MIIFSDGGFGPKTGGYGSFKVENDDGTDYALIRLVYDDFICTNNRAEYQTLLEALQYCQHKGFKDIHIFIDSQLVARQLSHKYKIRNKQLAVFAEKIWLIIDTIDNIEIQHVPRKVLVEKVGH